MKTTLNTFDIARALKSDSRANWSYNGAMAMDEYLEKIEDSTGKEMELDVVDISSDYTEHESLTEWASDYFGTDEKFISELEVGLDDEIELDDAIRDFISQRGTLIEFDGGVIVSNF